MAVGIVFLDSFVLYAINNISIVLKGSFYILWDFWFLFKKKICPNIY